MTYINGISIECLTLILEEKVNKEILLKLLKNTIENSIESGKSNNRYFTPTWDANIEGIEVNLLELNKAFDYMDMYQLTLNDIN